MKISMPFFLKLFLLSTILSPVQLFSNHGLSLEEGIPVCKFRGQSMKAVILAPADSIINGLPVLTPIPENDSVANYVYRLFENSYMREAVKFYYTAQKFLINIGELDRTEPAYLLLSQHQGGFPKFGFYLLSGTMVKDKSEVPYIELVKNNLNDEDHLGSMTQIYPHEMGHIIYHLLCKETDTIIPASIDIHYSTLATDFVTAFNEGFAMHFENMARLNEPDTRRKEKIMEDLAQKKKNTAYKIKGFERDFTWPFRIGLYRIAMLTWYQTFEDIKRYEWVTQYRTKYNNASLLFNNPEKSLQYRNSGIRTDSILRLPQRSFATEGVIASFFTGLLKSEAKNYFPDSVFYSEFATPAKNNNVQSYAIDPMLNQYMKIFYVLHHGVNFTLSKKSQFIDFVSAYIHHFPDEEELIADIFSQATGYDYPMDPGTELWITNEEHTHGILVMEQFGGITLPFYTFNLNAATEADILTLKGISKIEAQSIVKALRSSGPFSDYVDIRNIPGIQPSSVNKIINSAFRSEHFKKIEEEGISLSINDLIYSNLRQILIMGGVYFLVSIISASLILRSLAEQIRLKTILIVLGRFILYFFLAIVCVVMAPVPPLYFIGVTALISLVTLLILKQPDRRKQYLFTTLPMIIFMIYVLI